MADTSTPGNGDEGKPQQAPGTAAPSAAESSAPGAAASAGGEGDVPAEQLKQIIAALQADLDAARDERMHLLADMDNLRKRSERERADTAKYAVTKFAQDIVGVVDNFERAAAAVPADAAERDPALKSFLGGVELAEREFLAVLERHGVKRIDANGQPFNPHQHQAVMEREDANVPAGTVVQVFQAGFMIEERCLRPAMVVVSTGGPRAAKPTDAPAAPPESRGEPKPEAGAAGETGDAG
jgi:molecular chaperone GrpE